MIPSSITHKQLAGMPKCCSHAQKSIVQLGLVHPRRGSAEPVVACTAARQQHAVEHVQRRQLVAGLMTVLASSSCASSKAAPATAHDQDAVENADTDMRAFRASQLTTGAVVPALSSAQYIAAIRRARPGAADMVDSFLDMGDYAGLSTSLVRSVRVLHGVPKQREL